MTLEMLARFLIGGAAVSVLAALGDVPADWSALRGIRWHQYALRFALGGVVTAAAGVGSPVSP